MNHAFGGRPSPFVAVPVFPATWIPLICARNPLPSFTTDIIIWVSAAADTPLIAVPTLLEPNSRATRPCASRTYVTSLG